MDGGRKELIEYNGIQLNEKLYPVADTHMRALKENWYNKSQIRVSNDTFVQLADEIEARKQKVESQIMLVQEHMSTKMT